MTAHGEVSGLAPPTGGRNTCIQPYGPFCTESLPYPLIGGLASLRSYFKISRNAGHHPTAISLVHDRRVSGALHPRATWPVRPLFLLGLAVVSLFSRLTWRRRRPLLFLILGLCLVLTLYLGIWQPNGFPHMR